MDKVFLQTLGKHIANLRKQKGMSQEDFAELSGKMINTVSNIERGLADPRITTLYSFAKTLMSQRSDIIIDVVLVSSSSRKMKCLVEKTNGKIYSLNDVSELPEALSQSINGVQTEEFKEQKFEFLKF